MVSLLGIVLVVGATLCFSLFDLLRKKLTGRLSDAFLVMVLALGAVPLYGVWVALQPPVAVSAAYVWPGVASVVCNLGANYGFLRSVRLSGLSAVIPLLSLTPVFTSLLAIPLLGELPGARGWLGIAMVVFGALALQLGERSGERRQPWRLSAGAWWMILVAFLWASALPLDKLATEASNAAFHGLVLHLGVGLSVLTLALRGLREAPGVRSRADVRAGSRDLGPAADRRRPRRRGAGAPVAGASARLGRLRRDSEAGHRLFAGAGPRPRLLRRAAHAAQGADGGRDRGRCRGDALVG